MAKLNQIVALVAGKKTRLEKEYGDLNKTLQKHDLFNGLSRTYRSIEDNGEKLPAETKNIVKTVDEIINEACTRLVDIFDAVATQETGNCSAKANIVVNGTTILSNVPVTVLLYLEKQLNDLNTFVSNIPTLDASEQWRQDSSTGHFVTEPVDTHRTKKVQKPIVLYDATDKHPAQTQLITEDILVGYWTAKKISTAMPMVKKVEITRRIQELSDAVKVAREKANDLEVSQVNIGKQVLDYVFARTN